MKLERREKARRDFEETLRLNPGFDQAGNILNELSPNPRKGP